MRLFVALDVPAQTRAALREQMVQLAPKCAAARWVSPDAIHVTLKFMGHTPEENMARIRAALGQVRSHEPIKIHFRGLGFFPDAKRPRVFWCGVEMSANTPALASEIDRAIAALKIGVEPETRPFAPHVTLARIHSQQDRSGLRALRDAADQSANRDFGSMQTDEFHLFASNTRPTGAEYERLDTFRFTVAS